jgi:hypothetical protein
MSLTARGGQFRSEAAQLKSVSHPRQRFGPDLPALPPPELLHRLIVLAGAGTRIGRLWIMRAITISLTLGSLLLVGLLSPSLAQPTAILGRKEDVMVWVLVFEILLALIIGFVVLRSQSASPVGQMDELE